MIPFYTQELREVFGETLVALGRRLPRLVVLDADLNTSTRTILFRQRFPDRFIQGGIAEANLLGLAAGLAAEGFVAVPVTFAAFCARKALDQAYLNVAYPRLDVKIVGAYAGLTATECGPSHNAMEDLAVFRALPGVPVVDPGDNRELASALEVLLTRPGPCYLRVPRITAPVLFPEGHVFTLGQAYRLREGDDLSLLSTGMMTGLALAAADRLAALGVRAEVWHHPTIKPLDEAAVAAASLRTGHLLTLENHRTAGGFGGAVAEVLGRTVPARLEMAGIGDEVVESAPLAQLLRHYHLTPRDLAGRALNLLRRPPGQPA